MTSRVQFGCLLMLLLLSASLGQAQVINSGARTITLNATLNDSISVNLSGHAVNFTLTAGSANNPGSTSVTATTTWISKPGRNVSVYAYFSNSTAALSDGFGNNIPSARFFISNNGAPFAPLTNTVAFGGATAGLTLSTTKVTGTNKNGTHADTMLFNIDLTTIPQLPAGVYTGTLTIQAQVI